MSFPDAGCVDGLAAIVLDIWMAHIAYLAVRSSAGSITAINAAENAASGLLSTPTAVSRSWGRLNCGVGWDVVM